jgi:hypothetical protein
MWILTLNLVTRSTIETFILGHLYIGQYHARGLNAPLAKVWPFMNPVPSRAYILSFHAIILAGNLPPYYIQP